MRVVGARVPTVGEDRRIYSTVDSTAAAGQTAFAVNYDEGKVAVWLNGIRLVQGQDFTNTASGVGSQITLSSGIVANDYVEVVGYQGIYSGNALVEDRFVVGTSSTGSGGSYTNSTTVFPVANNAGDLVCVYRNGIKLVHTTDFVVSASGNTVTLQSAANTADEITVHVIGILQHSNFVPTSGGTFTGTVAHTGDITFGDNNKAKFGASNDLEIYHTGAYSAIVDNGAGNLVVAADDLQMTNAGVTENYIRAYNNDRVELYFNNGERLRTTSTGVNVAGSATVTGDLTVDTDTLKVDSTGNKVGIGTSPSTLLHLVSAQPELKIQSNGSSQTATISMVGSDGADAIINSTHSSGKLKLQTNSSDKLTIDSSGNVGIGGVYTGFTPAFSVEGTNPAIGAYKDATNFVNQVVLSGNVVNLFDDSANYKIASASNRGGTGETARLTVSSGGDVTVNTGNLVIGNAGQGIDFSNASGSHAGATGSVLDDYEEGNIQSFLEVGGSPVTVTSFSEKIAFYVKIGNVCHVFYRINTNAVNIGSGDMTLILPFNSSSNNFTQGRYTASASGSLQYNWWFRIQNNTDTIELFSGNNTSGTFTASATNQRSVFLNATYNTV